MQHDSKAERSGVGTSRHGGVARLVSSLLAAIVRADGDALVMHVGEKPYVVAALGPVELSSRPLTVEAVTGILSQLLPAEARRTLDDVGAVEHELPPTVAAGDDRFTVVAARGGDDIWIELRRHRRKPVSVAARPFEPVAAADIRTPSPPAQVATGTPAAAAVPSGGEQQPEPPRDVEAPQPEPQPAAVLPLSHHHVRAEPAPPESLRPASLDRLLRLAAARGATALYLMTDTRPAVRVDGKINVLEGEPPLGAPDIEALLMEVAPERSRQAVQSGEAVEWVAEVPEVGRVRCTSVRDHRGPGGIFRIIAERPPSAEHLGLSKQIQDLLAEPEGLVLVAGPRASGKSTLVAAMVDLINRSRSDHVITVESQITCVHESRSSLVSQREVRGSADEIAAVVRAALREEPDVLVIEHLGLPQVAAVAIEAVASGHLVIGTLAARTTAVALARLIEPWPPEKRAQIQAALAEGLRGVVAQVLLRKIGGGLVAARELLLNMPPVATLIAEGRLAQIAAALDSGRKHGMVPLNDALVAFVQSGIVDVRDAYREASDRAAFLSALRREGLDTSFAERLA